MLNQPINRSINWNRHTDIEFPNVHSQHFQPLRLWKKNLAKTCLNILIDFNPTKKAVATHTSAFNLPYTVSLRKYIARRHQNAHTHTRHQSMHRPVYVWRYATFERCGPTCKDAPPFSLVRRAAIIQSRFESRSDHIGFPSTADRHYCFGWFCWSGQFQLWNRAESIRAVTQAQTRETNNSAVFFFLSCCCWLWMWMWVLRFGLTRSLVRKERRHKSSSIHLTVPPKRACVVFVVPFVWKTLIAWCWNSSFQLVFFFCVLFGEFE